MGDTKFKPGQCVYKNSGMVVIDSIIPGSEPKRYSITYVQTEYPYASGGGSSSWSDDDLRHPKTIEERLRCRRIELQLEMALIKLHLRNLEHEFSKVRYAFKDEKKKVVQK